VSFPALLRHVAARAAVHFSTDATARPLMAWFPPAADTYPASSAGYTIQIINHVHQGPARLREREVLGLLTESENRLTLHLLQDTAPDGLPYLPLRNKTTLLLGYNTATDAIPYRILDYQQLGQQLELSLEKIT
jgi:hypothetical protein